MVMYVYLNSSHLPSISILTLLIDCLVKTGLIVLCKDVKQNKTKKIHEILNKYLPINIPALVPKASLINFMRALVQVSLVYAASFLFIRENDVCSLSNALICCLNIMSVHLFYFQQFMLQVTKQLLQSCWSWKRKPMVRL